MRQAPSARFSAIAACGLLLLLFFVTAKLAWRDKSATYDEPLNYAAAWLQAHYNDYRCDPEDPPLWHYYLTLGTSKDQLKVQTQGLIWDDMLNNRAVEGLFFRNTFYYTPGNDVDESISAGRTRMILIGVLLGALIALCAWGLRGPLAAVVACAAFCLDPNFLAHSPLVKNDVIIVLAFLLLMASVWLAGRRVTAVRWIAVALALGIVLTVKFSGLLALPILALALIARALLPEPLRFLKWTARSRARRFAVGALICATSYLFAYGFIWACYRFHFGPNVDPHQLFDIHELFDIARRHQMFADLNAFFLSPEQVQNWNAHWHPGIFLRVMAWIESHRLLPQAWIEGLMFIEGNSVGRAGFLLGNSSMSGWWYYFPVAMAVKTPVTTIVILILSAGVWLFRRPNFKARAWDIIAFALLPVVYMIFSLRPQADLGLRYILPVYPFIFIFIGVSMAALRQWRPRIAATLILLFLTTLAIETYSAFPNFIPFFNIAAGGWSNGPKLLSDSNVDWGQELPALAQWQREHPQYQLFLNYFGSADPRYYQIHYVKLPGGQGPEDQTSPDSRSPVYAISGASFNNPWLTAEQQEIYQKLWRQKPIAVLGHCIYLYNSPGP